MRTYCEECGKEVNTKIVIKNEVYNVLGENIEVEAKVLTCAECGEELFDEALDNQTLLNAYNEYRRRHKLLTADEIKCIREQYGLSQRSFAKLLNCGDKTIRRYENGSIQDKVHNSLLLFLKNPENMKAYLAENEVMLDEKQKAKLLCNVEKLLEDNEIKYCRNINKVNWQQEPTIENGYKIFDYEKLCAVVLFFANKSAGLLKTKLLKLINYSDLLYFKEHGISITGNKYIHLPYGPVMQHYEYLFGSMEIDGIAHIDIVLDVGYESHQVIPDRKLPENSLTDAELEILDKVYMKFKNFGSVDISNYSHQEKGYIETKQGEVISYAYANELDFNRS